MSKQDIVDDPHTSPYRMTFWVCIDLFVLGLLLIIVHFFYSLPFPAILILAGFTPAAGIAAVVPFYKDLKQYGKKDKPGKRSEDEE